MLRNLVLITTTLLIFSGCNMTPSKTTIKPTDLEGNGVLIGKIDSNGKMATYADAYIDGKKHADAIFKSNLALTLKPGTYHLDKIGVVYQGANSKHYEGYPINRKFTIKAGRITNIGQIFAYYKTFHDKQYRLFSVDNSNDILSHLKKQQPDIYPLFKNGEVYLAKGDYISKTELNNLKKLIAYSEATASDNTSKIIVNGELGTVARISRDRKNKINDIEVIKTGTLDEIKQCSQTLINYACIITNADTTKILSGTIGGSSKLTDLSINGDNVKIHLHGKNNIVLVDEYLNLYESDNGGKSFSTINKFARKEPIQHETWYNLQGSKKGYYLTVFSLDQDKNNIIYKPYKKASNYNSIALPEGVKLRDLNETKSALILGGYPGSISSSDVYYMPNGSNEWKKTVIPTISCHKIDVLNYNSGKLRMTCGYVKSHISYYLSNDSGATWEKI